MVQIQELNDSLRRSKEMSKEVISARRAAKEAVEDMAEQNAKLIQAYLEKKKEIKEVWAHCSAPNALVLAPCLAAHLPFRILRTPQQCRPTTCRYPGCSHQLHVPFTQGTTGGEEGCHVSA